VLVFSQIVQPPIKCNPVSPSCPFKGFQGNYSIINATQLSSELQVIWFVMTELLIEYLIHYMRM